MKRNKSLARFVLPALAALWAADATAAVVQLEKTALDPQVLGGGGRTEFTILDYQGTTGTLLGPVGSSIYAVCIEPNEFIGGLGDTNLYEIASLAGAPTSQTPGIEAAEVDIIERVLSEKFTADLNLVGTGDQTAAIAALQAILWEASVHDLFDNVWHYGDAATQLLASGWVNAATGWDDTVSSYALLVDGRQDFITFTLDPSGGPSIPVPAPLLLIAGGLLGLRRLLRKH